MTRVANWSGGSKKELDGVAQGRDRSIAFPSSFAMKGHRNEAGSWSGRRFLTSAARGLGVLMRIVQSGKHWLYMHCGPGFSGAQCPKAMWRVPRLEGRLRVL